jgi:hypothetical protein
MFPLRVLKQIIVMFFSACGPSLRKAHPDLVGFVLNRSQRYFPQNVQIWAYLHDPVEIHFDAAVRRYRDDEAGRRICVLKSRFRPSAYGRARAALGARVWSGLPRAGGGGHSGPPHVS